MLTGGKQPSLKKGDLLVAPANSNYRYEAIGGWSSLWFHLAVDTAWSNVLPDDVFVVKSRQVQILSLLADQYLTERKNFLVDSHSAEQVLANLLVLLVDRELQQLPLSRKDNDIRQRIEHVWEQVVADLAYPWTTDGLARLARMSSSQFNRNVKRFHKEKTPMAVVVNFRMQRAREMLSFTDHTLEAIAANVGYETAFAFSRAFKRHVGESPSCFRKQIREK